MNQVALYDDQEELINSLKSVWNKSNRIIACCPTGFGKTRIAARIISGYVNKGLRVCFLVPRISLIEQTANSFFDLGITDITYVWRDFETDEKALVTISSIDTYIRRDKKDFDLVIHDEAHHGRKVLLEWMSENPDDRYLGLTATPYSKWMGDHYDTLIKSKSMKWLIENGRLSPYEVYAPHIPNLKGVKTKSTEMGNDYVESAISEIMRDVKVCGNILDNWLKNGENRTTIALCVDVNHANKLCIDFNKAGVNSEVVTAKTPIEERQRIFKSTKEGITKVIFSINCLTEGFDMPEVTCLINARPTKSVARYIQGIGRCLRYMDGKTALIFDHSGTTLQLGFPCDIEPSELYRGGDFKDSAKRKEKEKKEKLPKECPACNFMKQPGQYICPKCGFKPITGQDVEADESIELGIIKGKKKEYTKEDKQVFWSGLLGWQKKGILQGKMIKDGRIAHLYKSKFDVWPRGLKDTPKEPTREVLNHIKAQAIRYAKRLDKQRG